MFYKKRNNNKKHYNRQYNYKKPYSTITKSVVNRTLSSGGINEMHSQTLPLVKARVLGSQYAYGNSEERALIKSRLRSLGSREARTLYARIIASEYAKKIRRN